MSWDVRPRNAKSKVGLILVLAGPVIFAAGNGARAASPPPIRTLDPSAANQIPACVTPERLMMFLASRNPNLDPRYRDIARLYKQHGEAWRVRWDYAFFQMVVETNALMFRRGDGKSGDVNPKQYNFAGLGTTGGGVPGDAYRDASSGVLAQIQHLVVYSGERIERPIGSRTQVAQDDILSASASVSRRRPVTFQDLSGRWAADRAYGRTIEGVAERYRQMFCGSRETVAEAEAKFAPPPPALVAPQPRLALRSTQAEFGDASALGGPLPTGGVARTEASHGPANRGDDLPVRTATVRAAAIGGRHAATITPPRPTLMADMGSARGGCRVQSASFGGRKTMLIRAVVDGRSQFTALQVLDGFETSMIDSFARAHAPGATVIGAFGSSETALDTAYRMCATEAEQSGGRAADER